MKKILAGFLFLGLVGSSAVTLVSKWLQERMKKA